MRMMIQVEGRTRTMQKTMKTTLKQEFSQNNLRDAP